MNLLFHQSALGDLVLTFPMLRGIGGEWAVIAGGDKAAMAKRVLGAQGGQGVKVRPFDVEMFEFQRLHHAGGPTAVSPAVGELFDDAQTVVSFVSDGKDAWAESIERLVPGAKKVYLDTRPPVDWERHVTEFHRERAAEQGLRWESAKESWSTRRGVEGGPVVVHPGSGGRAKAWPMERWFDLLERLRARGVEVVPVLGEVELDWYAEHVERWRELGAVVCRDLRGLCDVLEGAARFIGCDAGPTHLAAAMGVETLALFGPTDPGVWSPVGPAVKVLAPPEPRAMTWLGVRAVEESGSPEVR